MKRAAEHLGLEQAPLGTQLGTGSMKLPLWASLLPASRLRCEARALQTVFSAAMSTLVEGRRTEAKSQSSVTCSPGDLPSCRLLLWAPTEAGSQGDYARPGPEEKGRQEQVGGNR